MFFGIIIIIIGVLLLISTLGINIDFNVIWPILLVLLSIYMMYKNKKIDIVPSILLFIGIWMLLSKFNIIPKNLIKLWWPILIIILGIVMVIKSIAIRKNKNFKKNIEDKFKDKDVVTFNAIFSSVREKIEKSKFSKAILYAIFGDIDLDLTNLNTKNDILVNANSIFGDIEIYVPDDYNVVIKPNSFLGEVKNKTKNKYLDNRKTIYINALVVFGDIVIK